MLLAENPLSPGSSLRSCSLIRSMAPVPHVPSRELADYIPVRLRTLMCFVLNANYRKLFVNFKRKTLYPIRVHIYATYS